MFKICPWNIFTFDEIWKYVIWNMEFLELNWMDLVYWIKKINPFECCGLHHLLVITIVILIIMIIATVGAIIMLNIKVVKDDIK